MRTRRTTLAMSGFALTLAAGIWLYLAPFLLDYQGDAAAWATATKNHVATGAALAVLSLATLLGFAALATREALRRRGDTG